MYEINTTPFNTAIPHKAIKPTEAGTDKYSPLINKDTTPPIDAKGSTKIISVAKRNELKSMNNKKKMAPIVMGMMIFK